VRPLLLLLLSTVLAAQAPHHGASSITADAALDRLMKGNKRYVAHKEIHPDNSLARRKELLKGQNPFALILGCADSRVPPELVFDQGLGDLFVIRDAGNVVDDEVLGSIEYAVEHLKTPLIVVLGHDKCGAVTAAVEKAEAPGHIRTVVEYIRPSVEESANEPGDKVHNCVVANARRIARMIRESEPILKEAVANGKIKVVAANYEIETGRVVLLDVPAKTASQH
jgi:carbonic anhydrase